MAGDEAALGTRSHSFVQCEASAAVKGWSPVTFTHRLQVLCFMEMYEDLVVF